MSYYHYFAAPRPLPTGDFGLPPKAIYPSFRDYRASADFIIPRNFFTGELVDMNDERHRKLDLLEGPVVVHEMASDARWLRVLPYVQDTGLHRDEGFKVSEDVIARHFTLPHLHVSSGSGSVFQEYLCKYLLPGERVEVYLCWASEVTDEYNGPRETIDLEAVLRGEVPPSPWQPGDPNTFTTFLAPRTPHPEIPLGPVPVIDWAAYIILEGPRQHISLSRSQDAGLL